MNVAVVGAGLIGMGWAVVFAVNGHDVHLYDPNEEVLEASYEKISVKIQYIVKHGLSRISPDYAASRISVYRDMEEALARAEYVQESAVEDYQTKIPLFQQLDDFSAPGAIIASSSSGLLISRLQEGLSHPERTLIAHPFNPVYLIPLVELVPGPATSGQTVERAAAFLKELGKEVIILKKEISGHVGNRLAAALWREAIDLVHSGVVDVADVDRALTSALGLRWAFQGPHMTYHLNGGGDIGYFIKQIGPVFEVMWEDLKTWSRFPPGITEKLAVSLPQNINRDNLKAAEAKRDDNLVSLIKINQNKKEG